MSAINHTNGGSQATFFMNRYIQSYCVKFSEAHYLSECACRCSPSLDLIAVKRIRILTWTERAKFSCICFENFFLESIKTIVIN